MPSGSDPSSWPPPAWPPPVYPPPTLAPAGQPSPSPAYGAQPYAAPQHGYPRYGAPQAGAPQYGHVTYGYASVSAWPPVAPPRRVRRRTFVIAVVAASTLLVATVGGTALAVRSSDQRRTEALEAATAAVNAHLPGLEKFVASTTARPWKRAVTPEVLDDDAFVEALTGPADSSGSGSTSSTNVPADDNDDLGVTVAAMGLAPSADKFWAASDQGTSDNVVGFYDDSTGRLVVRGAAWSPELEYTLVHELTHANQDQIFDLSTMWDATRTDDESATALRALVEGEASLVADDYYQSQNAAWQAAVDARSSSATASDIPVVDTLAGFPYQAGEGFVSRLRDSGGSAAITKAYASPPKWTRDLVNPDGWTAGTLPKVTKPPLPTNVGGTKADTADYGVLGVLGLWMTARGGDPNPDDIHHLDGWTGDAYVSTENRDTSQVCFTDDVTLVDTAARDKVTAYLRAWLTKSGTTAVDTGPASMRLHRCQG